ncbi:MGMT family protein [archaeon]|nr:MGMT family protein [archaeon]
MMFRERVYEIVKRIPKGKVTTYKGVAEALSKVYKVKGYAKAYRAVGNALNKNRNKDVPCHRVVKSNGSIGGYAFGERKKIMLLKKEGIKIKGSKILNSDKRVF